MAARRESQAPGPSPVVVVYSVEAERIVAWLRLPAILLIAAGEHLNNPNDPAWYPLPEHLSFFLALLVYLLWSVAVLAWVHLRPVGPRFTVVTAVFDIAAITALTVLSGGPFSQTRLAYFIIPVVAAFRFRPAVTALAGGAGIVAYLAQAFGHPAAHQPEATRFIAVHAGYLAWVGLAAVTLSAQLQRRTRRIWNLVETRESLLNELVTAEERERQALAESLHDHAIQNLLSIRHELEEASGREGRPALERADATVMETVGELREIVSTLHPYVLEEAGLAAALRLTAERAARRGRFTARVDVEPGPPGSHDRLLIGAARELLANAAAHAAARRVTVRLSGATARHVYSSATTASASTRASSRIISPRGTSGWRRSGCESRAPAGRWRSSRRPVREARSSSVSRHARPSTPARKWMRRPTQSSKAWRTASRCVARDGHPVSSRHSPPQESSPDVAAASEWPA